MPASFPDHFRTHLALAALWLLAGQAAMAAPKADFVEGEVIVSYRPGASLEKAKASAIRGSAKMTRHFAWLSKRQNRVMGVVRSATRSTAALLAELKNDPDVLHVEPNYLRYLSSLQPNDPLFPTLWGLNNTGQTVNGVTGTSGADIRFQAAWNIARPSNGEVVVAVLDSGLDTTHPDIVANLWTNPGETAGNGVDDDTDGFIDDLHGFDFAAILPNVADSGDHGTHVAGTVAATGNNSLGVIGADFKARIMVLKVSADGTTISTSAEIEALEYAVMMKSRGVNIVAINASFAGPSFSTAESIAITAAGDAGIVFCAAAGNDAANNDTTPAYPANYRLPNMIVVAASTQSDQLAGFSNRGVLKVDLAAPGNNIQSLRPTWLAATSAAVVQGGTTFFAQGMNYAGTTPGLTATLINCGTGNSAAEFPAAVSNNIALIERGTQTFATKVTNAMNAGAIGAILYNNVPGNFSGTLGALGNWIPAVSVSQADGATLLALVNLPVTLSNAFFPGDLYQFKNGTSMATPQVAAAVAFSARNFPDESASQRVARVIDNTTPVAALSGLVKSGGRLNLLKIVDTNSNELPDWWETDHFPALGVNPAGDADGDGTSNLVEFLAGTNPNDSSSNLAILQAGFIPAQTTFTLTFASVVGVTYRVESSETLAPDSWTALGADLAGTGGILNATDASPNKPLRRFYRVRVIP